MEKIGAMGYGGGRGTAAATALAIPGTLAITQYLADAMPYIPKHRKPQRICGVVGCHVCGGRGRTLYRDGDGYICSKCRTKGAGG